MTDETAAKEAVNTALMAVKAEYAELEWTAVSVCRCNTRFIKEHKPSNHIRARIKSHVYTTE